MDESRQMDIAFLQYVDREFPKTGMDGEAFNSTPALDHFIAGWEACKQFLAQRRAEGER